MNDDTNDEGRVPVDELVEMARMAATSSVQTSWQIRLTPTLASLLLRNNNRNRRIRQAWVARLAADIEGGRWQANGDSVKVSISGELIDGQHRCLAVVEAGIAITTQVTFGVSDSRKVMATLDQNGSRTVSDIIQITSDHAAADSDIAATNMLGRLTGGVDLSTRPLQAIYFEDNIEEIQPWLGWASRISDASPMVQTTTGGRGMLRSIGRTPLAVLVLHMSRQGAPAESIRDFYEAIVGELPPGRMRELSDNQITISQIIARRLRNGKVLNRVMGGFSANSILSEFAVHINSYNKWATNARMEMAKFSGHYRDLDELPAVVKSRIEVGSDG